MENLHRLHRRSFDNAVHIRPDTKCGCFYCGWIFTGGDITSWLCGIHETTARCPRCGVDAVIYEEGNPAVSGALLLEMREKWFGTAADTDGDFRGRGTDGEKHKRNTAGMG